MATKKSTPKKTNTKTKTSVARAAGKGFAAGLNSTLGPDPKPYNRAKTSGTKTSTPKASNTRYYPIDKTVDGWATGDKVPSGAVAAKQDTYTGRVVPVFNSARQKYPNSTSFDADDYRTNKVQSKASAARGQRLNNAASMPKGNIRIEGRKNVIPSTHAANWSPASEETIRAVERHAKAKISSEERASNPRMYNNAGRKNDRAKNRK